MLLTTFYSHTHSTSLTSLHYLYSTHSTSLNFFTSTLRFSTSLTKNSNEVLFSIYASMIPNKDEPTPTFTPTTYTLEEASTAT